MDIKKFRKNVICIVFLIALFGSSFQTQLYAKEPIKLNYTNLVLCKGGSITLELNNVPDKMKSYKWSSGNTSVATISKTGKVSAKKAGTAKISCKINDGNKTKKLTCNITVKNQITKMKMSVGGYSFHVSLKTNGTAQNFAKMLPLTIPLEDLNGNEKYYFFPQAIKKNQSKIQNIIRTGDIMCYSNNCFVIFYETFSSDYAYVPIGKITNTDKLKKALGKGECEITFTAR